MMTAGKDATTGYGSLVSRPISPCARRITNCRQDAGYRHPYHLYHAVGRYPRSSGSLIQNAQRYLNGPKIAMSAEMRLERDGKF